MKLLVIGASGYIGSRTYSTARQMGIDVKGTQCNTEKGLIPFDILKDKVDTIDFMGSDEKYAFICAADANINFCKEKYEAAYKKNVIEMIRLIDDLKRNDYFVVFLSSDNVFSGKEGFYDEKSSTNPVNEYGKMKVEVENYICSTMVNYCIMRIGKTIGDFTRKKDVLVEWYNDAISHRVIRCIRGNVLTPVHVDDVVKCFFIICQRRMKGIYHIVGNEPYRRIDWCKEFFDRIKVKALIEERDLEEFEFKDNWPIKINMINSKFVSETGYQFIEMQEVYQQFIDEVIKNGE